MSPDGALAIGLATLLVLGAGAAWLLNIPPLAIGLLFVAGLLVIWRVVRRAARRRARQDTEA